MAKNLDKDLEKMTKEEKNTETYEFLEKSLEEKSCPVRMEGEVLDLREEIKSLLTRAALRLRRPTGRRNSH